MRRCRSINKIARDFFIYGADGKLQSASLPQ